ncbi:1,4-dihydroxy-6-naphthoate synthase [Paraliomyxa miuraensis]|uniref:1,4-dihydroxy-6-naphthoate synthase n=1 Tax=Paraliomyxa miuraensis TaxID=376150 RepID=UPI0022569D41|nr:1,4-dihydroxy-6-naphthoate synthase [Paraliomyxa miuraensis]MCX4239774.1 1,4-dihydroxy-6-naphthoate synthase [Paraliomyxa miuraensis]
MSEPAVSSPAVLSLGFSPCPNDTFMFDALVHGRVDAGGLRLSVEMDDIEVLNRRALGLDSRPPLSVTKVSVAALGRLTADHAVLDAGAALGRGCGPLVLRRADDRSRVGLGELAGARVAIPGEATTANLLLRIFGPASVRRVVMRFDEIMPALAAGEVDAGLVIHESRFTYPDHGLALVADLGERWEADTGLPLPLGVIVARRELPAATIDAVQQGLRASVEAAWADPDASRPYVRAHAQELSDDVCRRHIELYVNAFSASLGDEGRRAIERLVQRMREAGVMPADAPGPWR